MTVIAPTSRNRRPLLIETRWQGTMVETVVRAPVPPVDITNVESMGTLASTQEPPAWTTTT